MAIRPINRLIIEMEAREGPMRTPETVGIILNRCQTCGHWDSGSSDGCAIRDLQAWIDLVLTPDDPGCWISRTPRRSGERSPA